MAASKVATNACAHRVETLTTKLQALQSDSFLAEGRLLSLQHRLDESVFSSQQQAERASTAEASATSAQKMLDVLQKKHAALLSAIASEASLKRKRDQQPLPGTDGSEAGHRTLSLAAGAAQQQLPRHGGGASAASGGGGAVRPAAAAKTGAPSAAATAQGDGSWARPAASAATAWKGDPAAATRGPSRGGYGSSGDDSGRGRASSLPHASGSRAPEETIVDLSPLDDSPIKSLKKPRSRYAAH